MADDRKDRVQIGNLENFEQALRGAYETLWWRQFISLIKERRAMFVEALVGGDLDQRAEDRTRGQISELNFILSLDMYAEAQNGRPEQRT